MVAFHRKLHRRGTTVIDQTLRNVRDLVIRSPNKSEVARRAGLDEKSVRQAGAKDWNPRAETLARLIALLPKDWRAGDPLPDLAAGARGAKVVASGRRAFSPLMVVDLRQRGAKGDRNARRQFRSDGAA